MAEILPGGLYDYPRYYDLVFGSDCRAEARFLQHAFAKHARRSVQRIFEPACGTGRLLVRLASAGYRVAGIDLNEAAVAYCNARLLRQGFPATARVGDMTSFRLPKRVDACFNMINSFRHLLSESSACEHFSAVADALASGGIYVLGLHLTPTAGEATQTESWPARRGHLQINTQFRRIHRDETKRQDCFEIRCDIYTPTRQLQLRETSLFRTYTAAQFHRLLKKIPQLRVEATYDFSYDIDTPIAISEKTEDVVFILVRR